MSNPDSGLVGVGRKLIVQGLSYVEDIVYVGLGILLTIAALTLLAITFKTSLLALWNHQFLNEAIDLLDQILLILLVIELLYTVQVSFREHGLLAEPFLVVGLIAVIRRILVLTAELPKVAAAGEIVFHHAILELALLALMVLLMVTSLILLQRQGRADKAESEKPTTG
ncbi:MAG: phosphate-starvation-inducible PsiE family protein [Candidatus Korobacteraceae bacterium]